MMEYNGKGAKMKTVLMSALLISTLSLSGCGALHTAVAKRNLDVQTKMSSSIFLDPVEPEQRTIYVDIRNTSDKPEFDLKPQVVQSKYCPPQTRCKMCLLKKTPAPIPAPTGNP